MSKYYYIAENRFYWGKPTRDILSAQLTLADAFKRMPGHSWHIVEICA